MKFVPHILTPEDDEKLESHEFKYIISAINGNELVFQKVPIAIFDIAMRAAKGSCAASFQLAEAPEIVDEWSHGFTIQGETVEISTVRILRQ